MAHFRNVASLWLAVMLQCCVCATLGDMMRKEVRHAQFGSKGEVLAALEIGATSKYAKKPFCEYGYVLGEQGSNDCKNKVKHSIIVDRELCIKAATDAGVIAPQDNFVIPQDWETKKPEGCFHDTCAEDPVKGCFFYNPIGYNNNKSLEPNPTPVCSRKKYMMAKENSKGEEADCPEGYKPITALKACEDAGDCEDCPAADDDRPWIDGHNEALTLTFPKYCSCGGDLRTRFNTENDYWQTGTFDPAGTPICVESTPLTIESGE